MNTNQRQKTADFCMTLVMFGVLSGLCIIVLTVEMPAVFIVAYAAAILCAFFLCVAIAHDFLNS